MNYRMLRYLLGCILLIEAILMALPLAVSLISHEDFMPFVYTIVILLVISLPCVILKPKNTQIYAREGFVCVSAAWILLAVFGALPFIFSGAITNPIDAFFETVSGFTTTGATILSAVEHLPRGILFWRSFTHWIGGMGVLVF
ncbi:MAG: TrkH family potassium uptake protein, partial [Clostridia bacterium]|nr:TrkH family potassium uptake protein [Clostridia bacterium]